MALLTRTVPLVMLLNELRRLKAESGIKDTDAAEHLGCASTKINRILLGQSKATPGDAKMLGELYGASPELADVLSDLARKLGRKGDWSSYSDMYAGWLRLRIDLERYSNRGRTFQTDIVPALLQTERYVRALHEAPTPFGTVSNVDDVVAARRERQEILTSEGGRPMLGFILSESCLRYVYGTRDVMREQMGRLMEVAQLPNIQLQVLPFNNPSPVVFASHNFAILHAPGPGAAAPLDFVYVELYDDARYLDDHTRVEAYEQLWSYLQAAALGPVESIDFIGKVADEYKRKKSPKG